MTGRYSIPFCKKDFLYLLTLAPSDGYRRHLPRQAGTAYISCAFLFGTKVIYCFSKTHFTSAVILERWTEPE